MVKRTVKIPKPLGFPKTPEKRSAYIENSGNKGHIKNPINKNKAPV